MKGIPTKPESILAPARVAGWRRNDTLRRVVRIHGADGGEYTIEEVATRVGCEAPRACALISAARKTGPVTWEALRARHARRAA
jgi:hypothetical protein